MLWVSTGKPGAPLYIYMLQNVLKKEVRLFLMRRGIINNMSKPSLSVPKAIFTAHSKQIKTLSVYYLNFSKI